MKKILLDAKTQPNGYKTALLLDEMMAAFPAWAGQPVTVLGTVNRLTGDLSTLDAEVVVEVPDDADEVLVVGVAKVHDAALPSLWEAAEAERVVVAQSLVDKLYTSLDLTGDEEKVLKELLNLPEGVSTAAPIEGKEIER